jgi:ribonuclease VapC
VILDTSAIVALLAEESGAAQLAVQLDQAASVSVGSPALVEATMVLAGRLGFPDATILQRFVDERRIAVIPFGAQHWKVAEEAFLRYGRGRHPARLNFGDCLTYAVAKVAGEPLLCVGNDFAQTDLDLAAT